LFLSRQIIKELGLVYLLYHIMISKWYKKNQNIINKISAIIFVLSFLDLFILVSNNGILPVIIVIWLFYSVYKQGGLFKG